MDGLERGIDAAGRSVAEFIIDSREVCWKSGVMTGITGVVAGVGLGTFVGTMEGAHGELQGNNFKEQLTFGFRRCFTQSWVRSVALGKNFGMVGFVYQTIHCSLEKERAVHDLWNGIAAGGIAGAGFGVAQNIRSGAHAIARGAGRGAAAFAAFSLAVDLFVQHFMQR